MIIVKGSIDFYVVSSPSANDIHKRVFKFRFFEEPSMLINQQLTIIILIISFVSYACQESRDPQTPDGALRLFGMALEQGDQSLVKASLSEKTSKLLKEMNASIQQINKGIQLFPSKKARTWAKQEAYGEVLKEFTASNDEMSLLNLLIGEKLVWAQKQPPGTIEQGLNQRRILSGSIDSGELVFITRSDNQVALRKEGIRWVVTSFEEPLSEYLSALNRTLSRLEFNRKEWKRRQKLDLILPKVKNKKN